MYFYYTFTNVISRWPGAVQRWGMGEIAIKPRPRLPKSDMKQFDELKASAYRCIKERSVAFKYAKMRFPLGSSRRFPKPPSRLGTHHPHSTPRFAHLRRLSMRGTAPKCCPLKPHLSLTVKLFAFLKSANSSQCIKNTTYSTLVSWPLF